MQWAIRTLAFISVLAALMSRENVQRENVQREIPVRIHININSYYACIRHLVKAKVLHNYDK